MSGKELIDLIESPSFKKREGRNLMGCSESMYDPNYLVYSAYKEARKLDELSQKENIDDLLFIAGYAAEVFY